MPESRGDLSLAAALRLMSPLVELLLQEGVTYPRFTNELKKVFLEAAQNVLEAQSALEASSARVNDSSISMLSGVHRKDVREWRQAGKLRPPAKTLGAAMEVYTRWISDPAYSNHKGEPRLLERTGASGSFEELAASVSTDVHARTVLEELLRLGVVAAANEGGEEKPSRLRLCAGAFVPKEGHAEMLQLFADNVGDHIAAAARNIEGKDAPLLEQSVFADGLSVESAEALGALARKLWARDFQEMARVATQLTQQDQGLVGAEERVRLGMYFYSSQSE